MITIRKNEAVVFVKPGKVAIQEFNLTEPGPEDVLVEIEYSSIMARGAMHLQELITHTFPFREAPKAYKLIEEKLANFLGIILDWKK